MPKINECELHVEKCGNSCSRISSACPESPDTQYAKDDEANDIVYGLSVSDEGSCQAHIDTVMKLQKACTTQAGSVAVMRNLQKQN